MDDENKQTDTPSTELTQSLPIIKFSTQRPATLPISLKNSAEDGNAYIGPDLETVVYWGFQLAQPRSNKNQEPAQDLPQAQQEITPEILPDHNVDYFDDIEEQEEAQYQEQILQQEQLNNPQDNATGAELDYLQRLKMAAQTYHQEQEEAQALQLEQDPFEEPITPPEPYESILSNEVDVITDSNYYPEPEQPVQEHPQQNLPEGSISQQEQYENLLSNEAVVITDLNYQLEQGSSLSTDLLSTEVVVITDPDIDPELSQQIEPLSQANLQADQDDLDSQIQLGSALNFDSTLLFTPYEDFDLLASSETDPDSIMDIVKFDTSSTDSEEDDPNASYEFIFLPEDEVANAQTSIYQEHSVNSLELGLTANKTAHKLGSYKIEISLAKAQELLLKLKHFKRQYHIEEIDEKISYAFHQFCNFIAQCDIDFDFSKNQATHKIRIQMRLMLLELLKLENERIKLRLLQIQQSKLTISQGIQAKWGKFLPFRRQPISADNIHELFTPYNDEPFTPYMSQLFTPFVDADEQGSSHTQEALKTSPDTEIQEKEPDIEQKEDIVEDGAKSEQEEIVEKKSVLRPFAPKREVVLAPIISVREAEKLLMELYQLKVEYIDAKKIKDKVYLLDDIFDFFNQKVYTKDFTGHEKNVRLRTKLFEMLFTINTVKDDHIEALYELDGFEDQSDPNQIYADPTPYTAQEYADHDQQQEMIDPENGYGLQEVPLYDEAQLLTLTNDQMWYLMQLINQHIQENISENFDYAEELFELALDYLKTKYPDGNDYTPVEITELINNMADLINQYV